MTKPTSSVVALMSVDEGNPSLDNPVSQYLPEFKDLRVHAGKDDETVPAEREMTVRDLLQHSQRLTCGFLGESADTALWIAPRSELVVIVLWQLQPAAFELQSVLRSVIYAAIK